MNYQTSSNESRPERVTNKQETIRELAKRHMMDPNHTTTDEELRNAIVELDLPVFTEFSHRDKKSRANDKTV